jgi:hypothetical protein
MPPQQSHRLLDGLDKRFGFGAHFDTHFSGKLAVGDFVQ